MNIHTLHVEHVVFLATFALLTVVNSWLYKGMKGVYWFSLYSLFVCIGATGVVMRGRISDLLSIVAGNMFVAIGYSFFFLSIKDFLGRKTSQFYFQVFLLCVAAVTMLQYGWFHPDTGKRLIAYSFVLFCQQAHSAWFLYRNHDAAIRIPANCLTLMAGALAISNLVRVAGVSLHGAPANYLDAGPFLVWILILMSCLQAGVMIAYVWMTAAMLLGKLEILTITDPLTGALNRRGIEVAAERCIFDCKRDASPLSAIVLDLDNFKQINDSFGHHCGDATLVAVANCIRSTLRTDDRMARIGGDEFAVLLPDTAYDRATEIAGALRRSIAATPIAFGQVEVKVTASLGLAQLESPAYNWEELFMSCDKILYQDKGRLERFRQPWMEVAAAKTAQYLSTHQ